MFNIKKIYSATLLGLLLIIPIRAQDLFSAIRDGNITAMEKIINEDNLSVHKENSFGWQPLHYAAIKGNIKAAELLLKSGSQTDCLTKNQETPLFFAVRGGNLEMVNKLIDSGASAKFKLPNGDSYMHIATTMNRIELIEPLIKNGAEINHPNYQGITPLHLAALWDYYSLADVLLKNGASAELKTKDDLTPLDIARQARSDSLVQLLYSFTKVSKNNTISNNLISYYEMEKPEALPLLFFPETVLSYTRPHSGLAVSPDGNTLAYVVGNYNGHEEIWIKEFINGQWGESYKAPFSGEYPDKSPYFNPIDGKLYFSSFRPESVEDKKNDSNIWSVEKNKKGWGEPVMLGNEINTEFNEGDPSISANGNLYFYRMYVDERKRKSDIFISPFRENKYLMAEHVKGLVNSNGMEVTPRVSPDENYIIFQRILHGAPVTKFISLKSDDGRWGSAELLDLDSDISLRICQSISPDGKYLFFNGEKEGVYDFYWAGKEVLKKYLIKKKFVKN